MAPLKKHVCGAMLCVCNWRPSCDGLTPAATAVSCWHSDPRLLSSPYYSITWVTSTHGSDHTQTPSRLGLIVSLYSKLQLEGHFGHLVNIMHARSNRLKLEHDLYDVKYFNEFWLCRQFWCCTFKCWDNAKFNDRMLKVWKAYFLTNFFSISNLSGHEKPTWIK